MLRLKFFIASFLFRFAFPIYKFSYFRFKRKHDRFIIELMEKYIKEGNIVFDIGANIGFFTEFLSNLVGVKGKVHCFEPDNLNFKYLEKGYSTTKNVVLNKLAVSDTEGEIMLYMSDRINVENTTYKPLHYSKQYKVKKNTIDNYIDGKYKISFIKMDIQGAELEAFKGMKRTISENENLIILTELWPYGLKNFGITPAELISCIRSLGLNIYLINENGFEKMEDSLIDTLSFNEKDYYNILTTRKKLED